MRTLSALWVSNVFKLMVCRIYQVTNDMMLSISNTTKARIGKDLEKYKNKHIIGPL